MSSRSETILNSRITFDTMRSMLYLTVCLALTLGVMGHRRQEQIPPNRCLPGQRCFPSRQTLAEFAATLTGSVVTPADSSYSSLVNMANSRLTRLPYIIVLAGAVQDVQKAMLFARKHQLMVTSQASRMETSGRSTYDGSIQINLSNLKGVTSLSNQTARSGQGEITASAGTTWETVYSSARSIFRDVVSASNLQLALGDTVGDGGIGPLVRIYGLVSDNLLEAQVVTADGNLVTVKEYSVVVDFGEGLIRHSYDRAMFAALSSGGVGPFGVVVSYTFKLYTPPPAIVSVEVKYSLWEAGDYVGAEVLKFVTGVLESLPTKWGGYLYTTGATSTSDIATKGQLWVNLFYYDSWKADADYNFVDNLLNFDATDSLISVVTTNLSSVLNFERRQPPETTGTRFYSFNTLLQSEKMKTVREYEEGLNNALLFVLNNPTVESLFGCRGNILGGAVENDSSNTSFVNPHLRSSVLSLNCFLEYPGKGESDKFYINRALDFAEMFERFSEGKYRPFAEEDLPKWKQELHGGKHAHLIETKLKYDIDNFLWCHNCVGSDFRLKCGKKGEDHHSRFMSALTAGRGRARDNHEDRGHDGRGHDARLPFISQMRQD